MLLDDIQKKEKDTNEVYARLIFMQGMFAKMTGVTFDSLLAQTTADISRLGGRLSRRLRRPPVRGDRGEEARQGPAGMFPCGRPSSVRISSGSAPR